MEEEPTTFEEQSEIQSEAQMEEQLAWQENYGVPTADPVHNKHAFIDRSLDLENTEKVTYLTESELGVPMFNVRFLLDIEDISHYYIDEMARLYGQENKISKYFRDKIKNISDSGLSNKGFIQNTNISNTMNLNRKKGNIQNLKGGKKK